MPWTYFNKYAVYVSKSDSLPTELTDFQSVNFTYWAALKSSILTISVWTSPVPSLAYSSHISMADKALGNLAPQVYFPIYLAPTTLPLFCPFQMHFHPIFTHMVPSALHLFMPVTCQISAQISLPLWGLLWPASHHLFRWIICLFFYLQFLTSTRHHFSFVVLLQVSN